MQLSRTSSIAQAVTALTAALLGTGVTDAHAQSKAATSLLLYSEKDRVSAAEGIVDYSRQFHGEYLLGLKLTYDALTGASPNGALPTSKIQTFTRPSGQGSYRILPGQTPLDDTFRDTRFALDGNVTGPLGRLSTLTLGGHISTEHDYSSVGINLGLTRDFNRKNTTVAVSGAYTRDNVKPEGGAPDPFGPMRISSDDEGSSGGEDDDDEGSSGPGKPKDVFDFVFGVNQVIDRQTLLRLNYSYDRSSGYLTDPYKLLSVVLDENSATPGETDSYVYEKRPDSHNKHALYAQLRRYFSGNAVDLSYRYFWDSWGTRSHTIDVFYWWQLTEGKSLQPHVRWYHQSRADIYRAFLVQDRALPDYASADSRLAKFDALTFGLQYTMSVGHGTNLSATAEYYTQMGDASPPEAIGAMKQYDLFPTLNAIMFRVGLSRDF